MWRAMQVMQGGVGLKMIAVKAGLSKLGRGEGVGPEGVVVIGTLVAEVWHVVSIASMVDVAVIGRVKGGQGMAEVGGV